MGKNGRIKKIGHLSAYGIVLLLFVFDCVYFWISKKLQVFHYNKLTEFLYGKHVTSFSGVYLWAFIFFIIIPIVFFIFREKNLRTVVLFALSLILHLVIGIICVCWLESMDNDGTYDDFGDLYCYEQPNGNLILCIQEVYASASNPEDSREHKIIYVQTGNNTLKKVREWKIGSRPVSYKVSWKNDRVRIFQELWDEDKLNNSPFIDIYYNELSP